MLLKFRPKIVKITSFVFVISICMEYLANTLLPVVYNQPIHFFQFLLFLGTKIFASMQNYFVLIHLLVNVQLDYALIQSTPSEFLFTTILSCCILSVTVSIALITSFIFSSPTFLPNQSPPPPPL